MIKLDMIHDVCQLSNTLLHELQQTQDYIKTFVRRLDGIENPQYRNILYMKYIECLTVEKIAERLCYTERHVNRLLSAARKEFYKNASADYNEM